MRKDLEEVGLFDSERQLELINELGGVCGVKQVCDEYLRISRQRIHQLVDQGKIRAIRLSGVVMLSIEDVFSRGEGQPDEGGRPSRWA